MGIYPWSVKTGVPAGKQMLDVTGVTGTGGTGGTGGSRYSTVIKLLPLANNVNT